MLLEAKNITKIFKERGVRAVDGVSLSVGEGETLGILGESGSGKSTLARILLGLLPADAGGVYFKGRLLRDLSSGEWKSFRKKVSAVFQHPAASLNPKMKVSEILSEPFYIHGVMSGAADEENIIQLLKQVDLNADFLRRTPRQMSGGECQRVAIARALGLGPELVICDEPVSSLDSIVQVQILNLLLKIQREKHLSLIFISHDENVVRHMSDRIVVMKDGRLCE